MHATPQQEIWLVEALLVGTTCALPLTPFLERRWGRAGAIRLCVAVWFLTCVIASQITELYALVACLFFLGAASAPLLALSQELACTEFASKSTGMAFWNVGGVLGALAGAVGTSAAMHVGAPAMIFFQGWPAALVALLCLPSHPTPQEAPPFDARGFVLLSGAIALASCGLALASDVPAAWMLLPPALLLGAAYVSHAWRSPAPLVSLQPLTLPRVAASILLIFAFNALCSGQLENNYLVSQLHLDPDVMVLRTLLLAGASLIGVALGARASQKLAAGFVVALVVTLIGKIGFLFYGSHTTAWGAIWPVVVSSVGFWMAVTVLSTAVVARAGHGLPAAIALFGVASQLGGAMGVAALDGLFEWQSQHGGIAVAYTRIFALEWLGTLALVLGAAGLGKEPNET